MRDALLSADPEGHVVAYCMSGGTDAKHLASLRIAWYRLLPGGDSPPWRRGPHAYVWRTRVGTEHALLCRRPAAGSRTGAGARVEAGAEVEVVLDSGALAASSSHFRYGVCEPSPDGTLIAYSVDLAGDELYELRFRDASSGGDLPERIPDTS